MSKGIFICKLSSWERKLKEMSAAINKLRRVALVSKYIWEVVCTDIQLIDECRFLLYPYNEEISLFFCETEILRN
jgi:hypothetical protein